MCKCVYERCYEQYGWIACIYKKIIVAWFDIFLFLSAIAFQITIIYINDIGWIKLLDFGSIMLLLCLIYRCCERDHPVFNHQIHVVPTYAEDPVSFSRTTSNESLY